jgi:hypothetical protein
MAGQKPKTDRRPSGRFCFVLFGIIRGCLKGTVGKVSANCIFCLLCTKKNNPAIPCGA